MSEESEQGDVEGAGLCSGQRAWKWDGSLGWSRAEKQCGLMLELRDSSDGYWKGGSRSS